MPAKRGKLIIFLGYAAGVGKTYKMLEEAHAAQRAGRDIVIGYFEPHGRKDTIEKTAGLEIIPRRQIEYRGRWFEEMDTDAILARHPEICAVDEFPHTNIPGSARAKRWEDVMVLLDAGIDVMTTMNIQHLESLNDQARGITGVQVRETIPDWVMAQAEEVVAVDLPPRALLNRLERGVIYGSEKAQQALANFFKEPALAALRELALRQTAHEVEIRQADQDSLDPSLPRVPSDERILILVTEAPETVGLIRRGRRVADYLGADCFAVCVLSSAMERQPGRRAPRSKNISSSRGSCASRRACWRAAMRPKRWWNSRAGTRSRRFSWASRPSGRSDCCRGEMW